MRLHMDLPSYLYYSQLVTWASCGTNCVILYVPNITLERMAKIHMEKNSYGLKKKKTLFKWWNVNNNSIEPPLNKWPNPKWKIPFLKIKRKMVLFKWENSLCPVASFIGHIGIRTCVRITMCLVELAIGHKRHPLNDINLKPFGLILRSMQTSNGP